LEKQILTIGVASCIGGSETTCHTAPGVVKYSEFKEHMLAPELKLYWQEILEQEFLAPNRLKELININHRIASYTAQNVLDKKTFLVISGDHSSAMGTWAGVQNGINKRHANSKLGLIWFDAHLDAHTLRSSPSGNFHGMPVSGLLGLAEPALLNAYPSLHYIAADELVMYGIRSYESSERSLLEKHQVKIYPFEINSRMEAVKEQFVAHCKQLIDRCDVIGISLDLDILDPFEAPAVETPVANGLKKTHLLMILENIKGYAKERLIGLEISEFNPINDINKKTEKAILEIINQVFSK